jgi:hypothetical protein
MLIPRILCQGYYSYPCEHNVSVSLTFGGVVSCAPRKKSSFSRNNFVNLFRAQAYNMSSSDFNLGPFGVDASTNRSTCLGAFFDLSFGSSSKVSWVVSSFTSL